jgi:glucans biosynthesis protein C
MVLTKADGAGRAGDAIRMPAIDWMRAGAVLVIFIGHVARIFDFDPDGAIKNSDTSLAASVCLFFTLQWPVPLLFLLAGVSTGFSLRKRSARSFLGERVTRLVIPLLFGTAVLVPWIAYMSALNHASFDGSFWRWLPVHVQRTWDWLNMPHIRHGFVALYYTSWHLWFLGYLLIFSVCAAVAFRPGLRTDWFARLCARRFGLLALVLPLVVIKLALGARFPAYLDWSDTLVYFTLFTYGWLFMTDARCLRAVERQALPWLAVGCASFTLILGSYALGYLPRWLAHPSYSPDYLLYQVLCAINTWAWVLGVAGCGLRWLDFENAVLRYAGGAVLPFYVLHQVAIATIGALVVRWHAGIGVKALVISTAAFAATMLAYELGVRRIRPMRVLLGLKGTPAGELRRRVVGSPLFVTTEGGEPT